MASPILNFNNRFIGETCLLIGNGPSLNDIPLGLLNKYPSIGSNTIVKSCFTPTYYVAVDHRVYREFSYEVNTKYRHVPKFLLSPKLDEWTGENIYRFDWRVGYAMHAQMMLAEFMGFHKMLLVGADHTQMRDHFWGEDEGCGNTDTKRLEEGYKKWSAFVVNISTYTELSEDIIPRGNWSEYI